MRVMLEGQDGQEIGGMLAEAGLTVVTDRNAADAIICHGGDGTLIGAEREFPGVPKVPVRPDARFHKCPKHETLALLRRVASGAAQISKLTKIEARSHGECLFAMNDIVLHNARVTSAVRYRVWIDGAPYSSHIVGDGLVVSTPFGSTAYYRSITNSVFRVGIGLAFNNSTESVNHLVLDENAHIDVQVTRGPALLVADNMPGAVILEEGSRVVITKAKSEATIWELGSLTCLDCRERETERPAGQLHLR